MRRERPSPATVINHWTSDRVSSPFFSFLEPESRTPVSNPNPRRRLVSRETAGAAVLLFVSILAALGWIFSMNTLRGMTPLYFIGIRFTLAGLVLIGPALSGLTRLPRRDLRRAAVSGLFLGLSMISWIEGLRFSDNIGVGAFISGLGSIVAPLAGGLLFRWRVGGATWTAVAIATAGLALLSIERGLSLSVADLFFLGTALATSLNLSFTTRYAARIPVLQLTTVQMFVVGVVGLIFAAAGEPAPGIPNEETLFWLAVSVLVATSFRFFLQVKGQSMTPLGRSALILTMEPVWTALIAVFWLGSTLTLPQTAGCALIFAASLVSRKDTARGADLETG